MDTHARRRRQQSVLRPRQSKNDVNTGALHQRPPEESPEPGKLADVAESMRRCAERDLI